MSCESSARVGGDFALNSIYLTRLVGLWDGKSKQSLPDGTSRSIKLNSKTLRLILLLKKL